LLDRTIGGAVFYDKIFSRYSTSCRPGLSGLSLTKIRQKRYGVGAYYTKGWWLGFEELVKSPKISQSDYSEILTALWNKMFVSNSVYVHQEEERVVTPIIVMLNNGLELKEIENLLDALPHKLKAQEEQLEPEKYWFLVFNMRTFIKSFYVKINKDSKLESLQNRIDQYLEKI
jgi:hypothetical protein